MSDNTTFTADQSKLLRKLDTAMENFYEHSLFSPSIREARAEVVMVSWNLMEAFPKVKETAREYYFAEVEPDESETSEEGYTEALFSTFLSLLSFEKADSLSSFISARDSFYSDWFDTLSYSGDWDVERGSWKTDQ